LSRRAISFLIRHRAFLALLSLAAILRVATLLHAQTHVHNDEAIIGLMGTRILEGRHFPVYMAGQRFNGGAAVEAYLAAGAFALFGPGVVQLKACIVLLSLLTLTAVYAVARRFWEARTALIAATVYAVAPSLLKWHFQVRGYAPYLLAVPVLFGLFLLLLETRPRSAWRHFTFGLVAGVALWCVELVLPVVLLAIGALLLRRAVSLRQGAAAVAGTAVGYLPALYYNFTHSFAGWKEIAEKRLAGEPPVEVPMLRLVVRFFLAEMPRFFGPDTVLWYFPERSVSGAVYWVAVLLSLVLAAWSVRKRVAGFFRDHLVRSGAPAPQDPTIYALLFLLACLPAYLLANMRVPGYLIGAYPFVAVIVGGGIAAAISRRKTLWSVFGGGALAALLAAGLYEAGVLYRNPGIETLLTDPSGDVRMGRIAGVDIEQAHRYLRENGIRFVHASPSFRYPVVFESGETIHASAALFGWRGGLFPDVEAQPPGEEVSDIVLVFESGLPIHRYAELPAGDRTSEHRFGSVTVVRLAGSP